MSKVLLDCNKRFPLKKSVGEALSAFADADSPLVLELSFLSEGEIRSLNARERGVDAVTDVLSFPAADFKAGVPIRAAEYGDCTEPVMGKRKGERTETGVRIYLGSVAVCKKRAEEQAEEYGHSVEREICYLIVHGFLHCLGYDHIEEADRAVMRAREEEIMEKLGLRREA